MGIVERIGKIPFRLLLGIVAFFLVWDFSFTYLSLMANPNAYESNPVNAFFVSVFGPEYFLFSLPLVFIFLFAGIKLGGKLVSRLEKGINGENHIALLLLLMWSPNIFTQVVQVFFGTRLFRGGFAWQYPLAIGIMAIYLAATEYDLWRLKKRKLSNTLAPKKG